MKNISSEPPTAGSTLEVSQATLPGPSEGTTERMAQAEDKKTPAGRSMAYGISVRLFGGNQDKHSLTLASNLGHHQLQHHKPLCEIQVNTG